MFKKEFGDWTKYRELHHINVDFHYDEDDEEMMLPYYEKMEIAGRRSLSALINAQKDGIPYVLFTHGYSTFQIGKTTHRSVVRALMMDKKATPYIIRKNCIQHDSVFVAAIRLPTLTDLSRISHPP